MNILIVEDDFVIAQSMQYALEKCGHHVLPVSRTYQEAISCLETHTPDIAIIDIVLIGKKTGIDVAEYIDQNLHIPYIFSTSYTEDNILKKANKKHAYTILTKPYSIEDLYITLELAIEQSSSTHQ